MSSISTHPESVERAGRDPLLQGRGRAGGELVLPDFLQPRFREICRTLRRGGRAVISGIVSDEDVPEHLQRVPLWHRARSLLLMMAKLAGRQAGCKGVPSFDAALREHGLEPLVRGRVTTLQVNVGKVCNMACHHCHVDAGPARTEAMPREVADRVIELLERSGGGGVETLDLTGGAPELNPNFRRLVTEARRLGCRVIDRCNLTVLFEPGQEDLPDFLAAHQVWVVASLPCYREKNVEQQRGRGTFRKSIEALGRLNALGYGRPGSGLELDLVYNPVGAVLPPDQAELEADYREELSASFGITFNRLLTIANMPIRRFAQFLERSGQYEAYVRLLADHFNPATVPAVMCRSLLSIGWDGSIHDCDFNQMLELPGTAEFRTIWDFDSLDAFDGSRIATAPHCYGCTAGAGSSCSGALQ